MCEIFGVSFHSKQKINSYLKEFYSHSDHHPHGWGLAIEEDGGMDIDKEPLEANKSVYLKERLSTDICVKNALAHIRYATIGNVKYNNAHPFSKRDNYGRKWTMVHNGTIFEFYELNYYFDKQKGDTDSERILLYLIDKINQKQNELKRPLEIDERCELLNSIMINMSISNKINLMIYDGEVLYAHCNYYGTLYYLEKEDGFILSTQPLSDEHWKPVPFTRLLALKDGKLIYEGINHQHEYREIPEDTKFLYTIFADL